MRVLCLVNNRVGLEVLRLLRHDACAEVAGLVLHPPARRRLGEEILEEVALPESCVFDGARLADHEVLEAIRGLRCDLALSAFFGYILRPTFIDIFPAGVVNLHPAFLPWNRGAYPNVWSIVDDTPAGVSLHYIDEGVDTGDLIARQAVPVDATDTGGSLYRKLEDAQLELFRREWPAIREGRVQRLPQPKDAGSFHRAADVEGIDEIDLDRDYRARDLIDILRARTFPPHSGAYIRVGGRKIHLELRLHEDD